MDNFFKDKREIETWNCHTLIVTIVSILVYVIASALQSKSCEEPKTDECRNEAYQCLKICLYTGTLDIIPSVSRMIDIIRAILKICSHCEYKKTVPNESNQSCAITYIAQVIKWFILCYISVIWIFIMVRRHVLSVIFLALVSANVRTYYISDTDILKYKKNT